MTERSIKDIKSEIRQCGQRIEANRQFVIDNAHQTSRNLSQAKDDAWRDSHCVGVRRSQLLQQIGMTLEQFVEEERQREAAEC